VETRPAKPRTVVKVRRHRADLFPPAAKAWWSRCHIDLEEYEEPGNCWNASAILGGRVVAILLFRLGSNHIDCLGTWVQRSHRRRGIGAALWRAMIKRFAKGRTVHVNTTSMAGTRLVQSLSRSVSFKIRHNIWHPPRL